MFAAFAEKLAMGRGHRGGGWGRRGGRDDDDGSEGFGRGFGGRGGGGRLLGHGDLRLLLLALIGEKPSHGYDLIRAVEERLPAYAPSPGAVYPTLTMLEEQDLVSRSAEGSKPHTITDAEGIPGERGNGQVFWRASTRRRSATSRRMKCMTRGRRCARR
jgi:hypothetical protein